MSANVNANRDTEIIYTFAQQSNCFLDYLMNERCYI